MTFERFALKRPCVSMNVLLSFTSFILDEIHVRGPKIVYEHIWVGNILENIHKGPSKGPWRRTFQECPSCQKPAQPTGYEGNRHPVGKSMPRRWGVFGGNIGVEYSKTNTSLSPKAQTNRTVRWLRDGPSMAFRLWGLPPFAGHCNVRGEFVNSPHVQIRSLAVI